MTLLKVISYPSLAISLLDPSRISAMASNSVCYEGNSFFKVLFENLTSLQVKEIDLSPDRFLDITFQGGQMLSFELTFPLRFSENLGDVSRNGISLNNIILRQRDTSSLEYDTYSVWTPDISAKDAFQDIQKILNFTFKHTNNWLDLIQIPALRRAVLDYFLKDIQISLFNPQFSSYFKWENVQIYFSDKSGPLNRSEPKYVGFIRFNHVVCGSNSDASLIFGVNLNRSIVLINTLPPDVKLCSRQNQAAPKKFHGVFSREFCRQINLRIASLSRATSSEGLSMD